MHDILAEGEVVEPKAHVKVFGVIMDSSLKYKEHMVRASTKDCCGQTSNLSHRQRKMPNTVVQYLDALSYCKVPHPSKQLQEC